MLSAGHVGGTHGSDIVSSAADELGMSVVHGMRGVRGVCEMCMCLARGGIGGEWMRGLVSERVCKMINRAPNTGGGRLRHNLHSSL